MNQPYVKRSLEDALVKAASRFPAVFVSGPRGAGKTTLLRKLFGESHSYASFDLRDVFALAIQDPRTFLETYRPPVILDEAQHAPELFPYIKKRIDACPHLRGQFLIAVSENLALTGTVPELSAGRGSEIFLLPLSRRETDGAPGLPPPWEPRDEVYSESSCAFGRLWERLLRGGYPGLSALPGTDTFTWHENYIRTCIEHDVFSLHYVEDFALYREFFQTIAARSGQPMNFAEVSRDLGISPRTVKAWLLMLEATFQVMVVYPWPYSSGKRLVKAPKVYFTDTGTLCRLTGLRDSLHVPSGPMGGPIMETAVLSEIVKTLVSRGKVPNVFFWRTRTGNEVDFVVETEGKLVPVDVNLSATPRRKMARSIKAFREDIGDAAMPGYVVHPGDMRLPVGRDVTALPFAHL